jgi:ABC-2 type transport system ATP-binding protein
MTDVISVEQLTKVYAAGTRGLPLRAVDAVDFAVYPGEVFGFLGPNGAGKTSTIRMLTGLSRPTSGRAAVLGFDLLTDLPRIKKKIGVVPEASNLYDELSAFDNLVFAMQLYGVPRAERKRLAAELLERFRLTDKRDVLFARLSRGMKRALTIAAALAHHPSLLFLDEPTTGLDVMSARNLRNTIAELRAQGTTVFLTTHYLEEAARLCDRVAIIVKGRIVALDSVANLKAHLQQRTEVEITLEDANGGIQTKRFAGDDVASVLQAALGQTSGRRLVAVNTVLPTLEDVFVQLTGLDAEIMRLDKGAKG